MAAVVTGCWVGPHTRYVASKVEGRILNAGRPVANVRVSRLITVQHSGERTVQTAITDSKGRFSLPEVTTRGYIKTIATWVYQFELRLTLDNEERLIWKGRKTDNMRFGDYDSDNNYARTETGFFKKNGDTLRLTYDVAKPVSK